jgi:glycosyltransferase involved in cell wall biosynthesis
LPTRGHSSARQTLAHELPVIDTIRNRLRKFANVLRSVETRAVGGAGPFDREWYIEQYPDVRDSGIDPLQHYERYGRRDGRIGAPRRRNSRRLDVDWEFLAKAKGPQADAPRTRLEVSETIVRPATIASRDQNDGGAAALNIVIINHGPYDGNSGIHIAGFANALAARGHRVVVSASGNISDAGDFGLPRFRCIPHQSLQNNPGSLNEYFGNEGAPDLVHCWTPRRLVHEVFHPVIERYGCPYVIHFEDNEAALGKAYENDSRSRGASAPPRLAIVHEFVGGAAGATIIVDALKEVLPEALPYHLLEPGVDADVFAPGLKAGERERLCQALGVPTDAWITVYPGNVHPANYEDVFSLYAAIHVLNARGRKVHLIRTGVDDANTIDPRFFELTKRYVTSLGFVSRPWLVELLKLADFFVQPGGLDDFNRYRLPSKIPELLAMGKPVVLPKTNIGLLMHDRINAVLTERGDAAEITNCVEALLTDPELAARIGQEGRSFAVEHFNWDRSAKGLEGFYRQVLQRQFRS